MRGEREGGRGNERVMRGIEIEGSKIESKARMGTRNMENLPRRVSPKSDAFFQFSCRGVATSPPRPTPLVPLSSVLVVRASWCPVSPYTRHSSSLLPSLSLFLSPRPPLSLLLPFSSFLSLCSSALSHLSGVSTSISKKSSRELFVGKCREPAVLRTG